MKTNQLIEGLIVKNYKEMCSLLGETIKTGQAKQIQLKEWERFFSYRKDGHKFIIETIFDTPKEKIDGRKIIKQNDKRHTGNNNYYGELLQNLVLFLMVNSIDDEIILPSSILLSKVCMVNHNYSIGRRNPEKLSKVLNLDLEYINDFYNTTHSSLKSVLETALNNLDKKALLRWKPVRMVCSQLAVPQYNKLQQIKVTNGKAEINTFEEYREASKEEDLIILDAEKQILSEMKLDNINDVFRSNKAEYFYSRVVETISNDTNIKYYFKGYKIIFNHDSVLESLQELDYIDDSEGLLQGQVNQMVIEKIIKNAIIRHEKTNEEVGMAFGKIYYKNNRQKIRHNEDYLKNIQVMINTTICLNARNIKHLIIE